MKTLSEADIFNSIELNYAEIKENIRAAAKKSGRGEKDVRFMAVTKTVAPEYINHALSLGIDLIGENKVQELLGKLEFLNIRGTDVHIIGHLQSNKVRKITDTVSMIQSADGIDLIAEISKRYSLAGKTADILLEVNIGGEEAKTGLPVTEIGRTVEAALAAENVRLRGFMAVPPAGTPEETRPYFARMREIFDDYRSRYPGQFDTLSLGMSSDYAVAVEEGSTLVRVGSALFGARRY